MVVLQLPLQSLKSRKSIEMSRRGRHVQTIDVITQRIKAYTFLKDTEKRQAHGSTDSRCMPNVSITKKN